MKGGRPPREAASQFRRCLWLRRGRRAATPPTWDRRRHREPFRCHPTPALRCPSESGAYFGGLHDGRAIIDCDHPRSAWFETRLLDDDIRIPDRRESTIEMRRHCFRVLSALASLTSSDPITSDDS